MIQQILIDPEEDLSFGRLDVDSLTESENAVTIGSSTNSGPLIFEMSDVCNMNEGVALQILRLHPQHEGVLRFEAEEAQR